MLATYGTFLLDTATILRDLPDKARGEAAGAHAHLPVVYRIGLLCDDESGPQGVRLGLSSSGTEVTILEVLSSTLLELYSIGPGDIVTHANNVAVCGSLEAVRKICTVSHGIVELRVVRGASILALEAITASAPSAGSRRMWDTPVFYYEGALWCG
jgi:hypothetical protein